MKIRVWIHQETKSAEGGAAAAAATTARIFGCVWNSRDVITLRREHRIVGNLIGCPPKTPRQVSFSGLPLILQPEEITALVKEGVAETVTSQQQQPLTSSEDEERRRVQFERFREQSYRDQVQVCRDDRAAQIRQMAAKIVQGKKRKLNAAAASETDKKHSHSSKTAEKQQQQQQQQLKCATETDETEEVDVIELDQQNENKEEEEITEEAIIKQELEKIQDFPPQNLLIQTFNEDPWGNTTAAAFTWDWPHSAEDRVKSLAFQALRVRGFFLTSGDKFGADFLAYPGDPLLFHAKFVVLCLTNDDDEDPEESLRRMQESELVAKCRLGTAVNKAVLVAFVASKKAATSEQQQQPVVKFKKLQWTAALE